MPKKVKKRPEVGKGPVGEKGPDVDALEFSEEQPICEDLSSEAEYILRNRLKLL